MFFANFERKIIYDNFAAFRGCTLHDRNKISNLTIAIIIIIQHQKRFLKSVDEKWRTRGEECVVVVVVVVVCTMYKLP